MFIFNSLENLIFSKTNSDELKKENLISKNENSFHEILHNAVNDASRLEDNNLQTYSSISQDITSKNGSNLNNIEPFKMELFHDKFGKEHNVETFAVTIESPLETVSSKLEPNKEINKEVPLKKTEINSKLPSETELAKEEPVKEVVVVKEISSTILLQTFLNLDTKEITDEPKLISKINNSVNKLEKKPTTLEVIPQKEQKSENTDKAEVKSSKSVEGKDSKKVESKIPVESLQTKAKELKVETASKDIQVHEVSKEISNDVKKEIKIEDNSKLTTAQTKSKETVVITSKSPVENKSELSALEIGNRITSSKEEPQTRESLVGEGRKFKKTSEPLNKEKSTFEDSKPVAKEFANIEKEIRHGKEVLVEVAGLDKNKWTITRREKDMESSNIERRKESIALLNEIAAKSNSSQTSADSEKSFSNPRYETNGLKIFSETSKAANSDKPQEAGFNRENFSKSLNDLVNKARINIVENGRNSAQISLYPKDLGKMTLNIDVIREKVEGKILVDSEFIRNRLMGDVSQLKADLKANGLDLQNISIEVRSDASLAFDFANPSNDKESSGDKSHTTNSSLPHSELLEENSESEFSGKSYNLVDIKV